MKRGFTQTRLGDEVMYQAASGYLHMSVTLRKLKEALSVNSAPQVSPSPSPNPSPSPSPSPSPDPSPSPSPNLGSCAVRRGCSRLIAPHRPARTWLGVGVGLGLGLGLGFGLLALLLTLTLTLALTLTGRRLRP